MNSGSPWSEAGRTLSDLRFSWQPQRGSNPCLHLERVVSSATRRWGQCRRSRLLRVARGGGLEPPTTGPEPAVLPITPPPNGPDQPSSRPGLDHTFDPGLAAEPDDSAHGDGHGLAGHVPRFGHTVDR